MWDCKYHTSDDRCRRRKTKCFPGGLGCVLKGVYNFPFRKESDPLLAKIKRKKLRKEKQPVIGPKGKGPFR